MTKLKEVAVGGTFDQLHRGHKTLLTKALEIGEHITVGLCTDEFVLKMGKPHMTANYKDRLKELETFLDALGSTSRVEIVPLNDYYGTAVSEKSLEALVVSDETLNTALKINTKRAEAGLHPLKIVTINMVPSENCDPISTTKIRRGEIDREGRLLKDSNIP